MKKGLVCLAYSKSTLHYGIQKEKLLMGNLALITNSLKFAKIIYMYMQSSAVDPSHQRAPTTNFLNENSIRSNIVDSFA